MLPFELSETELRPDCRVIGVKGELDLAVADQLEAAVGRAGEYRVVLVDLSDCEFVDSTGVAALVHASQEIEGEGRKFAVVGPRGQVLRVLSISGLTRDGLIFESSEAALASV